MLLNSQGVIYAGIVGNLLEAAIKFVAAFFTGSSGMMSEAIHSLVDTGNSLLLLYGIHRAKQTPDQTHPLGYSREIYFWSFVVAVLVFALGAGISLYEGIAHILNPEPIQNPLVNYVVLALSAVFDVATWWLALRNFKGTVRYGALFNKFKRSKDPAQFMVLFEDTAGLIGLIIAFAGTYFSVALKLPVLDGVASVFIAIVLATTAILLSIETKGLLIGETADQTTADSILNLAGKMEGVNHANGVFTTQIGPQQIIAALSLEFADELKTPDIEQKVVELERQVRALHPAVTAIFIKPQTLLEFQKVRSTRFKS
ncbi:MAG: cation diffusion facilitator family transporter [Aestuariivirga sp.]